MGQARTARSPSPNTKVAPLSLWNLLVSDNVSPLLRLWWRLLGLKPEEAPGWQNANLHFATGWQFWTALALLLAAALWFGFWYYRDGTRPSWWTKGPLLVLRLIVVAALMTMLAQPVLRLSHDDSVKPNVILLVDNSESMARPDPRLPAANAEKEAAGTGIASASVGSVTRLERANAMLNKAGVIAELSKKYNVRLSTFASKPHALPLPNDPKQRAAYRFTLTPDTQGGDSTQIGNALRETLENLSGQPVAGALIVSDGGNNLGDDPLLTADGARQSNIAVSTVGLGDPTKTKDIVLLSLLADDVVRVNNTVSIYAALSQRGYAGKTVTVTLLRNGVEMDRQNVRLASDDQKQEIHFTYVPAQAGRFIYTVSVSPQPDETTTKNNQRSVPQSVISKKLKVLYVEDEPRYEYRYLHNAILRDNSLDFGCILLTGDDPEGEGNISVRGFPATEKELFDYDIIVLGDVPRSYFTQQQLEAIRRFVEDRGASLLVVAGEHHMPHEFAGTPLEAVLPVVVSASPDPVITEEPFQWQRTPEGRRSPILQLEDNEAQNDQVWRNLPGMFWAAGVPRVKPGATVLAVHPSRRNADGPYPLVAEQSFGAGKCYMELVDSTWRWRWRVGDRYFYRYWGQVFRTLTPKELPGNSKFVQLNADRSNYRIGEKVALNARLLDAYYHPIKAESAIATIKNENGQEQHVTLEATPNSPGLYTAQIQPDKVGRYEVSLNSPANPEAKASTAFVVESLALEKQKPELDDAFLKKLASAGGGKYYQPDELAKWMKSLPDNTLVIRSEQEVELWNAPLFLWLFILPLSIEWLVRKRKGLL